MPVTSMRRLQAALVAAGSLVAGNGCQFRSEEPASAAPPATQAPTTSPQALGSPWPSTSLSPGASPGDQAFARPSPFASGDPLGNQARPASSPGSEPSAAPEETAAQLEAAATPADAMLTLQIRLDRAGFSPGEIDGREGSNTRRALVAFRKARRGADPENGEPPLVVYTITEKDVSGPFVPTIPEDMMEKAKLERLGYTSLLEALAERFHASPDLLRRLNPGATFERAGERITVPNVVTGAPGKALRAVVDKSDLGVYALGSGDEVLARYPATMGSRHDPLPLGKWTITGVSRNPVFLYNPDLFWDADESHAKARIAPGPNNPVGVVWIDLSKKHYGIHGTPEPAQIGKTQSHGCIRLTNWDAAELADMVGPGMPAILQE